MQTKVLQFSDYRLFLKTAVAEYQKAHPRMSLRALAAKLKLADTSSLTKIINGQRHPGSKIIQAFCKFFDFTPKEEVYFRKLVTIAKKVKDSELPAEMLLELKAINPKLNYQELDYPLFALVANWYSMAIKEMFELKDFKEDIAWIQKRLGYPVSTQQAQAALEALKKLGLIQDKSARNIVTPKPMPSHAVRAYHKSVLDTAMRNMDNTPMETRHNLAASITTTKAKIHQAKKMIDQFTQELCDFLNSNRGDQVYQISFNLFPLTRVYGVRNEK